MDDISTQTYSTIIAISVAVGYWFGRVSRTDESKKPKLEEQAALSEEDLRDDCKLALIVRTDLGMNKGKIAAQCSHATLACYKTQLSSNPRLLEHWEKLGQTKVALRCSSEEELQELQAHANRLHLTARSIRDAGRTQVAAGSRTVLGVLGPARLVNQVTARLKLL